MSNAMITMSRGGVIVLASAALVALVAMHVSCAGLVGADFDVRARADASGDDPGSEAGAERDAAAGEAGVDCTDPLGCDGGTSMPCTGAGCNTPGKDEGAACATDVECKAARRCLAYPGTSVRACARTCTTDADCSGPGSRCLARGGPGKTCSLACDPVKSTKCIAPLGCALLQETTGERYTDCNTVGALQQNSPCSATKLCAPGYNCATDTGGGTYCAHYCRAGMGATDCPQNTTCNVPDFDNKIGFVVYGACFP